MGCSSPCGAVGICQFYIFIFEWDCWCVFVFVVSRPNDWDNYCSLHLNHTMMSCLKWWRQWSIKSITALKLHSVTCKKFIVESQSQVLLYQHFRFPSSQSTSYKLFNLINYTECYIKIRNSKMKVWKIKIRHGINLVCIHGF